MRLPKLSCPGEAHSRFKENKYGLKKLRDFTVSKGHMYPLVGIKFEMITHLFQKLFIVHPKRMTETECSMFQTLSLANIVKKNFTFKHMFFLILYWEVHKTYGTNDVLNNKLYISNFILNLI